MLRFATYIFAKVDVTLRYMYLVSRCAAVIGLRIASHAYVYGIAPSPYTLLVHLPFGQEYAHGSRQWPSIEFAYGLSGVDFMFIPFLVQSLLSIS